MVWIYPEQLPLQLQQSFKSIYILFGNDLFLLQSSQINIIKTASTLTYVENIDIKLKNNHFNWNEIFYLCKINPLFSQCKILSLHFFENYSINFLNKNIPLLHSLIHDNLILILLIYISNQSQRHKTWIQFLNNKESIIFVNCMIPNDIGLEKWIKNQSKHMKMIIENAACQLLCYYYESNNILLYQMLQYLSLVYPDGNLSYSRVKKIITDSAFFDSNQWVEAILLGNKQRANRILKKLIYINSNLNKLLYKIQHEILIIVQIKHSIIQKQSLYTLFKKYKIYTQHRRTILANAIQRLSFNQLNKSISLLIQMELKYHKDYTTLTEVHFQLLTEILCENHKKFLTHNIIMHDII